MGYHRFLICVNNMLQAITSTLLLYVDDSCICTNIRTWCKLKNDSMKTLETFLTGFFYNRLSIHFSEDKTESILFASKQRAKNICQLNIKYKDINITTFGSNISLMHARQDNVRRANDIKGYQ